MMKNPYGPSSYGDSIINTFKIFAAAEKATLNIDKSGNVHFQLDNRISSAARSTFKAVDQNRIFTGKVLERLSQMAEGTAGKISPDNDVDYAASEIFNKIQAAQNDKHLVQILQNTIKKHDFDAPEVRRESTELPLETISDQPHDPLEEPEVRGKPTELPLETLHDQRKGVLDGLIQTTSEVGSRGLAGVHETFASQLQEVTFTVGRELGRGANNVVYETAIHHLGEEALAYIEPQVSKPLDQDVDRSRLLTLIPDLRGLPNVGDIKAVVWKNPPSQTEPGEILGFLTTRMDYGLETVIRDNKASWAEKKGMIKGIVNGVAALHAKGDGIVHRDIKPANIMFKDGQVQIIDHEKALKLRNPSAAGPRNDPQNIDNADGTLEFLPPDIVGHAYANTADPRYQANNQLQSQLATYGSSDRLKAHDSYDVGLVLYEIMTGEKVPWITDLQAQNLQPEQMYGPLVLNHRDAGNNRDRMLQKLAEHSPNGCVIYDKGQLVIAGASNTNEAKEYYTHCAIVSALFDPDPRKRPPMSEVNAVLSRFIS